MVASGGARGDGSDDEDARSPGNKSLPPRRIRQLLPYVAFLMAF
jgi:hypothetical protein